MFTISLHTFVLWKDRKIFVKHDVTDIEVTIKNVNEIVDLDRWM